MTVGKMPSPAAAGDVGTKRVENQLKIQQLESDALRMRLIDAESSSDRRRRTLEHGTDAATVFLLRFRFTHNTHLAGTLSQLTTGRFCSFNS